MKTRILSLAIALITLIGIGVAYAANPQWNQGPCISGNVVKGKITGIGNGDLTIIVKGQVSCTNPAGKDDVAPWQDFTRTRTVPAPKNGNYNLNYDLKLCNNRWILNTQSVTIEVWQGGQKVLGPTTVNPC